MKKSLKKKSKKFLKKLSKSSRKSFRKLVKKPSFRFSHLFQEMSPDPNKNKDIPINPNLTITSITISSNYYHINQTDFMNYLFEDNIEKFPNLKALNVNNCFNLTEIPPLSNLKILHCMNCPNLTNISIEPHLIYLNCSSNNNITKLEVGINLRCLVCNNCKNLSQIIGGLSFKLLICSRCPKLTLPKLNTLKTNFPNLKTYFCEQSPECIEDISPEPFTDEYFDIFGQVPISIPELLGNINLSNDDFDDQEPAGEEDDIGLGTLT